MVYVPFKHVRAYVEGKSSRIGDVWNDRENFIALMNAMGYKKVTKHMRFIKQRKGWDNIAGARVPRRYFESIGVDESLLIKALKKDQIEYLKAVKDEILPEKFEVGYRWLVLSRERSFPGRMNEKQALEYVFRIIKEKYKDSMHLSHFWARIRFTNDLKSINIGKNLRWFVCYYYPDMTKDEEYYYFFFRNTLPGDATT